MDFLRNNFTEFDWEQEYRRDDRRIRAYLELLPKYQDLPDEDKMILREIQKNPDLRMPDGDTELLSSLPYEEDDDDDSEDDPSEFGEDDSEWETARASEFYKMASVLARHFLVYVSSSNKLTEKEILIILALYGKVLTRSNELIDMELSLRDPEGEQPPAALRIACCKRVLAGINELLGAFIELEKRGKTELSFFHTSGLNKVRDLVMKLLLDLRDGKA